VPIYLGSRQEVGRTGVATNPYGQTMWTVTFSPDVLRIPIDYEIYHISLKGPAPSACQVFIDTVFYSIAARGDNNDWDPSQPAFVRKGQTVYFYYSSAANPAPVVSLFARQPTVFM
jgi:hypothetical protein